MLDILRTKGKPSDLQENGGISMLEWLRRRRQTKDAIERFWRVVLVSALDEELARTDARFGASKRSEEHTSELQSPCNLVCRLLLEKKNTLTSHHDHVGVF